MTLSHPTAPQMLEPGECQSEQKSSSREIDRSVTRLCDIVEVAENVSRHATSHTSIIATGKKGSAPGELEYHHRRRRKSSGRPFGSPGNHDLGPYC